MRPPPSDATPPTSARNTGVSSLAVPRNRRTSQEKGWEIRPSRGGLNGDTPLLLALVATRRFIRAATSLSRRDDAHTYSVCQAGPARGVAAARYQRGPNPAQPPGPPGPPRRRNTSRTPAESDRRRQQPGLTLWPAFLTRKFFIQRQCCLNTGMCFHARALPRPHCASLPCHPATALFANLHHAVTKFHTVCLNFHPFSSIFSTQIRA